MRTSDFAYELPLELIAREPARPRDSSRMMLLDRKTGGWTDSHFHDLPELLNPSDVLVINDTRVIRARIHGRLHRASGSSRRIEVLFAAPVSELYDRASQTWEVLCRPGRRIRSGDRVIFGNGELEGIFGGECAHGLRLLQTNFPVEEFLEAHGRIPIPPYLEREDTAADAEEYQTIYAKTPGAVAAPTAGLHFTPAMFDRLHVRGIEMLQITLHVGIGTFIPVRSEQPSEHVLKPERYAISEHTASRLNAARDAGRRIIAVGTTSTRTLEYIIQTHGRFVARSGEADLFILPGYEFKAVTGMLTNFHLPKSTLIMLVSAFAGQKAILASYRHAVAERYRFYSYGDCMLIL